MILKVIGSSPVTYLIIDFYKLIIKNKKKKTQEISNIKVLSLYFFRFYYNYDYYNLNRKKTQEIQEIYLKKNKDNLHNNNIDINKSSIHLYNIYEDFFLLLLKIIFTTQTSPINYHNKNKLGEVVLIDSTSTFNFYYLFLSRCILNLSSLSSLKYNNNLYKKNLYINIKVNFKNFNCKLNILKDENKFNNTNQSIFISYGVSLRRFNILQKSFRRSKKFYSIFLNNLREKLLKSKILLFKEYKGLDSIKFTNVNVFVLGCFYSNVFIKSFLLLINELVYKSNVSNFNFFIKPNFRNSNNIFKKVKAIKKRIKKKLIKKYYKS